MTWFPPSQLAAITVTVTLHVLLWSSSPLLFREFKSWIPLLFRAALLASV